MKRFLGYLFLTLYTMAVAVAVVVEFVPVADEIMPFTLPADWLPQSVENEESGGCKVQDEVADVELLFVGDVMAHLPQVEAAQVGSERYDFGPHFAPVEPLFGRADFVVANLETTLSPRPPYGGFPAFATPDRLAHDLAAAGVDFVTLANNHIVDRGAEGVLNTIAALDNARIGHAGAAVEALNQGNLGGQVVVVGGVKIALLAYTYGVNGSIPDDAQVALIEQGRVEADLARLPEDVDLVVALLHWGNEYHRTPSDYQRQVAEWMRAAGVDLIVGSHPHVVQPFEEWRGSDDQCVGGVYYSLGNFISNQNDRHTDYGLAARVRVQKTANAEPTLTLSADTLYRHRYWLDGRQYFRVSPTRY